MRVGRLANFRFSVRFGFAISVFGSVSVCKNLLFSVSVRFGFQIFGSVIRFFRLMELIPLKVKQIILF